MRFLTHTLCTGLLASAALAQIPSSTILLAENAGFARLHGLRVVEYRTGKSRPLAGNLASTHGTIALDPDRQDEIWGTGTGGTFSWPITHQLLKGENVTGFGPGRGNAPISLQWARPQRFHVYASTVLMSLLDGVQRANSGVWRRSRDGKSFNQLVNIQDPYDMAVLGDKLYLTTAPQGTSDLYEIDLKTNKATKVTFKLDPSAPSGAKVPARFSAICAKGPDAVATSLMLVDDTGVVYEVFPGQAAWNITTQTRKGVAAPVAIAWHPDPKVGLIVATADKVYDVINYTLPPAAAKPFHSNPYPILDLALDLGNLRSIGAGCAGSNNQIPTMVYGGSPYQGNSSFSLRMTGGIPNAPAHLVIGLSRIDLDLAVIGAPTCVLHPMILVDLVFNLDAQGNANLPAAIPVSPALLGFRSFLQFGVADAAANSAGLTTSNAFEMLVHEVAGRWRVPGRSTPGIRTTEI